MTVCRPNPHSPKSWASAGSASAQHSLNSKAKASSTGATDPAPTSTPSDPSCAACTSTWARTSSSDPRTHSRHLGNAVEAGSRHRRDRRTPRRRRRHTVVHLYRVRTADDTPVTISHDYFVAALAPDEQPLSMGPRSTHSSRRSAVSRSNSASRISNPHSSAKNKPQSSASTPASYACRSNKSTTTSTNAPSRTPSSTTSPAPSTSNSFDKDWPPCPASHRSDRLPQRSHRPPRGPESQPARVAILWPTQIVTAADAARVISAPPDRCHRRELYSPKWPPATSAASGHFRNCVRAQP